MTLAFNAGNSDRMEPGFG